MSNDHHISCFLLSDTQAIQDLLSDRGFHVTAFQDLQTALTEASRAEIMPVVVLEVSGEADEGLKEMLAQPAPDVSVVAVLSCDHDPGLLPDLVKWVDFILPATDDDQFPELLSLAVTKLNFQCRRMSQLCMQGQLMESLREDIRKREEELSLLTGMSQLFHSCADEQALIEIADMYFPLIFSYAQGAVYLIEDDDEHLIQVYSWGVNIHSSPRFSRNTCQGLALGMPHSVRSLVDQDLTCGHIDPTDGEHTAAFCLPLISDTQVLGLMYLQADSPQERAVTSRTREESLSEKTIIARTVAESIALALSNIRLRRQLREMAIRDQLTGLYNRRYLEETLEAEGAETLSNGKPLSLIMFDIDHFKTFNDTWGHEAGDTVLSELGGYLLAHAREGDVPCRYGGEEIMLILPGTQYEDALERAWDICRGIAGLSLHHQDQPLEQVTISCGVAACPVHSREVESVVDLADKALYRAKQAGRNRVCGQE